MSSTFFGLNTAYTGLLASNAALNTTGNNISNVETKGYSRQEVDQMACTAIRTYTTYGCAGAGVDVISINRVRDEFYDVKYQNNNSRIGDQEVKQYYMKSVENYFADDATIKGFNTIFNEMVVNLSEVKKNAGDASAKAQFIGAAGNLADYFNSLSENLDKLQADINAEIQNKVTEVNAKAAEIASLNKQINVIELTGVMANELRDQRTLLLDDLSKLVDISTQETDVYNNNDPTQPTGAKNFIVRIAGGQTLVSTNEYRELECRPRMIYEKVNQGDSEGLYDIYWTDTNDEFGIYGDTVGGELAGLIELRDGNNGEYFHGIMREISTVDLPIEGETVTHQVVKISVDSDYLKDLYKGTLPENGGKINIGNQEYYYDSWKFEYNESTGECNYYFTLSATRNDRNITSDKIGKTTQIGHDVNYQGIPYYQEQMNEWIRTYAYHFNSILTQADSVDYYGNPAGILFTGDHSTDEGQYLFTTDINGSTVVDVKDDSYYRLTARNFTVSKELEMDSMKFATHTDASAGPDKYDVVDELLDLNKNRDRMSFRSCTAGEFLQCVLSDVALNTNAANNFVTTLEYVRETINNQRTSVSGVDNDEEALNLVKYQNAYNLSSKMIQVLTEIYDRLILQTGV